MKDPNSKKHINLMMYLDLKSLLEILAKIVLKRRIIVTIERVINIDSNNEKRKVLFFLKNCLRIIDWLEPITKQKFGVKLLKKAEA